MACHAYNWGLSLTKQILDYNRQNPDEKIKVPTAIDLHKWLVALVKSEKPWYYCRGGLQTRPYKCAPEYALRDLSQAWNRCFKKTAASENCIREYS